MKKAFALVSILIASLCLSHASAEQNIFNDGGQGVSPPSQTSSPPEARSARTQSDASHAKPSDDDLAAQVAALRKQNADLLKKVNELQEMNTILRELVKRSELAKADDVKKDPAKEAAARAMAIEQERADQRAAEKEKANQEREERKALAKRKAENERFERIQVGRPLSEAESLAHNRVKITASRIIQIPPRVGYFGPLQVREINCTLHAMKDGEDHELKLVVTAGTITSISEP